MKILYVHADEEGPGYNSSRYRSEIPSKAVMIGQGAETRMLHSSHWITQNKEAMELTHEADLVFFERNILEYALEMATVWAIQKKPIIFDFDDAYHLTPNNIRSYSFWKENVLATAPNGRPIYATFPTLKQINIGVTISGIISSPSQKILSDWKTPRLKLHIPNFINTWTYEKKTTGFFVIGWGGNTTHYDSFVKSGALLAIEKFMREKSDVVFVANTSSAELFYEFQSKFDPGRVVVGGWVTPEKWVERMTVFDLFIAPLYGEYDRRRSNVKLLDPYCAGIPIVASDFEPYHEFRNDPAVILTLNGQNTWLRNLRKAYDENQKMKESLLNRQNENIKKYDAILNSGKLMELYDQAIQFTRRS